VIVIATGASFVTMDCAGDVNDRAVVATDASMSMTGPGIAESARPAGKHRDAMSATGAPMSVTGVR
jgi:hypothetical protein